MLYYFSKLNYNLSKCRKYRILCAEIKFMMKNLRKVAFTGTAVLGVLLFSLLPMEKGLKASYTVDEIWMIHTPMMLNIDSSQYFPTQNTCGGCHGRDMEGFAMVDGDGNDVNMLDDWQTSMMANSAKDPFWRAKVSHEVLINPMHSEALQDKCTSCHAPMGNYTSKFQGHDHYLMSDLLIDTIGLDGVSCGACHQISTENLGNQFSGEITYDTNRVQYGPYENPFAPPMASFVGFTPIESEHILDAGICASCHTLITESVNLQGELTGTTFVEQATYHEWLNSQYNTDDVSCQGCHMPQLLDSVIISDNYLFLEKRFPYGLHDLVGANTFMIQLMKDNKQALDIDAADANFDETLFKTFEMLQMKTLDISLALETVDVDSAYFKVALTNKAGHKFPSGYPSRRAFIEFTVITELGDTLFKSGVLDENYEVEGQDPEYEPHYQVINNSSQVQIYELVDGDVNGNFTSVLERAFAPLKDNRLPPLGFTTDHIVYDTTQIVGNAFDDTDFNKNENGDQGTGGDIIYYHIPLNGYTGLIDIKAKVWYQSLPPKWMAEMFAESTPEIETFRTMYDEADQSAVLVNTAQLDDVFIESIAIKELTAKQIGLSPNPTFDGVLQLESTLDVQTIRIYNLQGQLMKTINNPGSSFELPEAKGLYFIEMKMVSGERQALYSVKILRM